MRYHQISRAPGRLLVNQEAERDIKFPHRCAGPATAAGGQEKFRNSGELVGGWVDERCIRVRLDRPLIALSTVRPGTGNLDVGSSRPSRRG